MSFLTGGSSRFWRLLAPSSTGLVLYSVFASLLLVVNNLFTFQKLLYGSEALNTQDDVFWQSLNERVTNFLGFSGSDDVAVYVFWIIIGLVIYLIIHYFSLRFDELVDDIKIRHYIVPNERLRNQPLRQYFLLFLVRIAVFIFTLFYVKRMFEFMFQPLENYWANIGWLSSTVIRYTAVFLCYVLLLHGLVVLIRILVAKQRIFS